MTAFNGMSYENFSLFEALAKKGFIVVSISSIGRFPGDMTMKKADLMEQVNDAVAALMAEAKLGVAKDKKNAVLLTLGTGVGGAILIDGHPYQGNFQKAGHIGHIVIDHEDSCDVTGMPGSLEDAIGNSTVQKRSLGKFQDTHALLEAYRKGDHFATWIWLSSVRKLALGIASMINVLSPDCVILGGGITEAGDDLFEPLEHFLSLYEWRPGDNKAFIVKAQFGDMAGAIGAACFALVQLRAQAK